MYLETVRAVSEQEQIKHGGGGPRREEGEYSASRRLNKLLSSVVIWIQRHLRKAGENNDEFVFITKDEEVILTVIKDSSDETYP